MTVSRIVNIKELSNAEPKAESAILQRIDETDSYTTIQQLEDYFAFAKQNDFQQEIRERKESDSDLLSKINKEIDDRKTAVKAESDTREKSDKTLQTNIDKETSARSNAVSLLQKSINGIDSRVSENESILDILTGDGNGSINKRISDAIANVLAEAPESFDTLKEIADWIGTHENSASEMNTAIQGNAKNISNETKDRIAEDSKLQEQIDALKTRASGIEANASEMQNSINENAETIAQETEERKADVSMLVTNLDKEISDRTNADSTLQANIDELAEGLKQEISTRTQEETEIYEELKASFTNQIERLTNENIGEIVDDRLSEIETKVNTNSDNITALETKIENELEEKVSGLQEQVSENKENIDTLNNTVYSETTADKILISKRSGTPEWGELSSLVKSVTVNTTEIDERGNTYINIPRTARLVTFSNARDSIDGFLVPFKSTNGNWYIHVSNWWGGAYQGNYNGAVKGTVYYID